MFVQFFKVTSLPSTGLLHAWYLVLSGSNSETYVTDASGNFKRVGNSLTISELVTQALDNLNTTEVVNNITDRIINASSTGSVIARFASEIANSAILQK